MLRAIPCNAQHSHVERATARLAASESADGTDNSAERIHRSLEAATTTRVLRAIFADAIGRPLRVPEPELRGFIETDFRHEARIRTNVRIRGHNAINVGPYFDSTRE